MTDAASHIATRVALLLRTNSIDDAELADLTWRWERDQAVDAALEDPAGGDIRDSHRLAYEAGWASAWTAIENGPHHLQAVTESGASTSST